MDKPQRRNERDEIRLWRNAEECAALARECACPHRMEALLRFARETAPAGRETPFSSDKPTTPNL